MLAMFLDHNSRKLFWHEDGKELEFTVSPLVVGLGIEKESLHGPELEFTVYPLDVGLMKSALLVGTQESTLCCGCTGVS